jgi:hypothetical protein
LFDFGDVSRARFGLVSRRIDMAVSINMNQPWVLVIVTQRSMVKSLREVLDGRGRHIGGKGGPVAQLLHWCWRKTLRSHKLNQCQR